MFTFAPPKWTERDDEIHIEVNWSDSQLQAAFGAQKWRAFWPVIPSLLILIAGWSGLFFSDEAPLFQSLFFVGLGLLGLGYALREYTKTNKLEHSSSNIRLTFSSMGVLAEHDEQKNYIIWNEVHRAIETEVDFIFHHKKDRNLQIPKSSFSDSSDIKDIQNWLSEAKINDLELLTKA